MQIIVHLCRIFAAIIFLLVLGTRGVDGCSPCGV